MREKGEKEASTVWPSMRVPGVTVEVRLLDVSSVKKTYGSSQNSTQYKNELEEQRMPAQKRSHMEEGPTFSRARKMVICSVGGEGTQRM